MFAFAFVKCVFVKWCVFVCLCICEVCVYKEVCVRLLVFVFCVYERMYLNTPDMYVFLSVLYHDSTTRVRKGPPTIL